ncbi:DUF2202 domain-containing protein [Algoriphagus limi]|uniref:DUF2202 domain-containing protein n=1 Tax=Algoriphagus limi TaxID=2975273 RepID=A0ABT2G4R5_9BACT|nr:DUF2202 domain-containing protein [Algoriphagus limi]MCS5490258.1 DUF2202 domain-containing protein [Algoriphagus limi]
MKKLLIPLLILLVSLGGCQESETPSTTPVLSNAELASLLFTREEEKLAHDVYLYAFQVHGLQVFQNIANSESQHVASVLNLMDSYSVADPLSGSTVIGQFSDQNLLQLYVELTARVDQSLEEAVLVGLLIEDMDILDLQMAIAETQQTAIINVYTQLQCGSENHMRSFYNQATLLDVEYSPAYISQLEFDTIVNSSRTSCQPN